MPIYNLTITVSSKGSKPQTLHLSRSFTEWFDEAGHFVVTPFQSMLATSVPVIGTLDPSRASKPGLAAAAAAASNAEYMAEELDAMLAAAGVTTAETTGSSAKKGGKKRRA